MKTVPHIPPKQWCKYYGALTDEGVSIDPLSIDACSWCLTGWIMRMLSGQLLSYVHRALMDDSIIDLYVLGNPRPKNVMDCYELLGLWNDATTTTHEMVNAFLDAVNTHIKTTNEKGSNTGQSSGLDQS